MKEENVDVETTLTEEVALAKNGLLGGGQKENASTVLGKFKDVDALARAYESLQAEFTRRSQRLRVLERAVEDLKENGSSGAEKLRKAAHARREAAKQFDAFVAEVDASTAKGKPLFGKTLQSVAERTEGNALSVGKGKAEDNSLSVGERKAEDNALSVGERKAEDNALSVGKGKAEDNSLSSDEGRIERTNGKNGSSTLEKNRRVEEMQAREAVGSAMAWKAETIEKVSENSAMAENADVGAVGKTDGVNLQEESTGEVAKEAISPQENGRGSVPFAVGRQNAELSTEELFQRAFDNEAVRLKIVGEYLSTLGRTGAPLTGGGVGVLSTPPARAKTVGQAGDMALLYFRTGGRER